MLNWRLVYFGKVKREDVQKYIPEEEWQKVRLWMKGKTLVQKYEALVNWLERCNYSHSAVYKLCNGIIKRWINQT